MNASLSRNNPECSKVADIPKSLFVIPPPVCIYEYISLLNDKLCFVQYTPEKTMIRRWYLAQVDLEASISLDARYQTSGSYYCHFMTKHPSDAGKSDDLSLWWPDWYLYSRDEITNNVVLGDRTLFRLNISPDHSKYVRWGNRFNLKKDPSLLIGPFDFEPISPSNRTRQKVATKVWLQLAGICSQRKILQPTVGIHLKLNSEPRICNKHIRKRKR